MKKGFTLIELLAVIIILAIVLVIAVIQVLRVIENSRINAFIANEQKVTDAARGYFTENRNLFPEEIGDINEVSISQLVNEGYISEVSNPYNSDENCNGYVIVKKTGENNYNYTPHLKCGLDIHNSNEDGLLVHYKFSDFQEPTTNLAINPKFFNGETNGWVLGGIGEITKKGLISDYAFNFISFEGSAHLVGNTIELEPGQYYMQVWYEHISGHIPYFWNHVGFNGTFNIIKDFEMGKGLKVAEIIMNVTSSSIQPYVRYAAAAPTDRIEGHTTIHAIQIEKKPYATQFTEGTREGIVRDYSGNNNNAPLNLETTPRWIINDEINKPVYKFQGLKDHAISTLYNVDVPMQYTLNQWIKGDINEQRPHNIYTLGWHSMIAFRNAAGGTSPLTGILIRNAANTSHHSIHTSTNHLDNNWNMLTATVDRTVNPISVKVYLNGKLEISQTIPDHWEGSRRIQVASWSDTYGNLTGYLGDSRIYNRVLSETEINMLYNSQK